MSRDGYFTMMNRHRC